MDLSRSPFEHVRHQADFCVVGGGLAGLCAALAAAQRGARTILMHDRPMLGGNSSSEVGVHVIGADRVGQIPHMRETGLLEELRLENLRRNPQAALCMWDLVLYDAARRQKNLQLLLNCSCLDAAMAGDTIVSVTGWQGSSQRWHTVEAKIFADCSGDGILAPLTGAPFRMGREGRDEFGESIAPPAPDARTMGHSHGFLTRQHDKPMPFIPFEWARTFKSCDDLPWGEGNHAFWLYSMWWCELGGMGNTIEGSEPLREDLLALVMGVWDHIKNRCIHSVQAANWALDRVQFVPGRRESRRYLGPHILTQNDIAASGPFEDAVAYGGWTMDDHHPAGFEAAAMGQPCTIHHEAPSPYGIPYRCLYSRKIGNLMFAGRVASCTHTAMSSTRVMGTCASMGQAVGTAAALAVARGLTPAGLGAHASDLQQMLLADDAYIPSVRQEISPLSAAAALAASTGDPSPLRDGVNRQVGDDPHCWTAAPGSHAEYLFDADQEVRNVFCALDSGMERSIVLRGPGWQEPLPDACVRTFRIETLHDGRWENALRVDDNVQRYHLLPLARRCRGVRLVLERTHGAPASRVYAFHVNPLWT